MYFMTFLNMLDVLYHTPPSEKPYVAAEVFSRHRSPYVEGNGVKWGGRIPVPCRFPADFSNLGLGDGTVSAERERG